MSTSNLHPTKALAHDDRNLNHYTNTGKKYDTFTPITTPKKSMAPIPLYRHPKKYDPFTPIPTPHIDKDSSMGRQMKIWDTQATVKTEKVTSLKNMGRLRKVPTDTSRKTIVHCVWKLYISFIDFIFLLDQFFGESRRMIFLTKRCQLQ